MTNKKQSFVPLILGTDFNAYGIVRTLYQRYGVHSHLYDIKRLPGTRWSSLVDVHLMDKELRPEHLTETMVKVATRFHRQGLKPVLYACGDDYTRIVVRHYPALSKIMVVPYAAYDTLGEISTKGRFYRLCSELHLPIPKFVTIVDNDRSVLDPMPFSFPVVIKPDDNVAWHQVDFPNYRKVFVASNRQELYKDLDLLQRYYHGSVLVQEYIHGNDSAMYVINGYIDHAGHLTVLSLGHGLLNDPNPVAIGNYLAILPANEPTVYRQAQKLISHLNIHGFINIDLKLDSRDGQYKFLDFNPRQGRSSYYTTLNGCPLATYPIEDQIYGNINQNDETIFANDQSSKGKLWLNVAPDTFVRNAPDCAAKQRALAMIENHSYGSTLRNSDDSNPLRRILIRHTENIFRKEFNTLHHNNSER